MGKKNKTDVEYPFNYTLDDVSIDPEIQASFLTQLPERKKTAQGFHQHITEYHHIFKHGVGCIMLWVCLSSERTTEFFRIHI